MLGILDTMSVLQFVVYVVNSFLDLSCFSFILVFDMYLVFLNDFYVGYVVDFWT